MILNLFLQTLFLVVEAFRWNVSTGLRELLERLGLLVGYPD
ncbi:MAG TPA: hypothetical protein V6D48_01520 [Oculatellaceae cyanobacterium]